MDFIRQQVKVGFQGVTADQARQQLSLTSRSGLSEQVRQLQQSRLRRFCADIRKCIAEIYDDATAAEIRIPVRADL